MSKHVQARASKGSLTARYLISLATVSLHPSLAIRNLFMKQYLLDKPDTTTEEFDQVWRTLDPKTKEVLLYGFRSPPFLTPL